MVPRELCRLSGAFANGGRGALSGSAHACWMCVYKGEGFEVRWDARRCKCSSGRVTGTAAAV